LALVYNAQVSIIAAAFDCIGPVEAIGSRSVAEPHLLSHSLVFIKLCARKTFEVLKNKVRSSTYIIECRQCCPVDLPREFLFAIGNALEIHVYPLFLLSGDAALLISAW
jgi:hypothetical protein